MSFRVRLLTAFLLVVLIPLTLLAIGVRREMRERILAQSQRRAEALAAVIDDELATTGATVAAALSSITSTMQDDPTFRASLVDEGDVHRAYLLDYAAKAMRASGLSTLQIRNDSGRILSSGHFPTEFDRIDRALPRMIASAASATLIGTRTAGGTLVAVARVDSARIGAHTVTVVGGRAVDQRFVDGLAGGNEMGVALTLPRLTLRSRGLGDSVNAADYPAMSEVVRTIPVAYIDATTDTASIGSGAFTITRSLTDAAELRRSIDRWILGAFLLAMIGAILTALWLAARLSRPMEDLAAAAAVVDLDRLDVRFAAGRDDEIGVLSRRLTGMVDRLRGSAARLREAERRATIGDIARQVNHDIKNGLAPIRNVVRHLADVARDQPSELAGIFTARQGTIESSIAYLETLARNYARLSPSLVTRPSDIDAVVAEVVQNAAARGATVRARSSGGVPPVLGDAVVLRRILENLVGNAVDALDGKPGEVVIGTERAADSQQRPMVRITVSDTGRGMTEPELARAFDDFYTTKPGGTGLGLSVVRRLVADLGGALRVETEPGRGTVISIDLPGGGTGPGAPLTVSR